MDLNDRIRCFLIDYGVYWDCNLACRYCRLSPIRDISNQDMGHKRIETYINGLTNVSQYVDAVMFKTSGWGEITQLADYIQLFHHATRCGYKVLQLITNGVIPFTEHQLLELQGLGYFSLQMSIDGLTSVENELRLNGNKMLLDRVFANLHKALRLGIPVEINTVLSNVNSGRLLPFFNELLRLREKFHTPVICVPRRVRVKATLNNSDHLPSISMIDQIEEATIEKFERYAPIFPPEAYLRGLLYQLRNGHRNWMTYDSIVRLNVGASGDIVIHTSAGNEDLGSVFVPDSDEAFTKRRCHHFATGDTDYQNKMTQFDVHYLYLDGIIPLSEMTRIPSCANPTSLERLQYLHKIVVAAKADALSIGL